LLFGSTRDILPANMGACTSTPAAPAETTYAKEDNEAEGVCDGSVVKEAPVCLITGASSGVGAEAAKFLAKNGIRVVLTGRRESKLQELVSEIVSAGGVAAHHVVDVRIGEQVQAAFDFAEKEFGGVDYVFANAGCNGNVVAPLAGKPDEEISDNLMTNAGGAIFALRSAIPAFQKRKGGAIVFTSSIFAHQNPKSIAALAEKGFGGGGAIAYNASKAAVDAVSRNAAQFKSDNIRSYCLQIGAYNTEMSQNSAKQASDAFGQEVPVTAFGANNPLFDTVGDPVHLAEVVLSLFNGTSEWQPGQTIVVDNDGTADASNWTKFLDAPADTENGLPSRTDAQQFLRNVSGKPYTSNVNDK